MMTLVEECHALARDLSEIEPCVVFVVDTGDGFIVRDARDPALPSAARIVARYYRGEWIESTT